MPIPSLKVSLPPRSRLQGMMAGATSADRTVGVRTEVSVRVLSQAAWVSRLAKPTVQLDRTGKTAIEANYRPHVPLFGGLGSSAGGHGNREMPMWGRVFLNDSGGRTELVQMRIYAVLKYIGEFQVKRFHAVRACSRRIQPTTIVPMIFDHSDRTSRRLIGIFHQDSSS
jgi:hypothetical protein